MKAFLNEVYSQRKQFAPKSLVKENNAHRRGDPYWEVGVDGGEKKLHGGFLQTNDHFAFFPALSNRGSTFKGKNLLLEEQFFP